MLASHDRADVFLAAGRLLTGCVHALRFPPPLMLCVAHPDDGLLCAVCVFSHNDGLHVDGRLCEVCEAAPATEYPMQTRTVTVDVLTPDAARWRYDGRLLLTGAAVCADCRRGLLAE